GKVKGLLSLNIIEYSLGKSRNKSSPQNSPPSVRFLYEVTGIALVKETLKFIHIPAFTQNEA
ncbi:MAG: hypothetical protein C0390_12830, partial [Syntrophus sp. (in: bacteria)]|nr:hypothetical protein [Syntrophus sp. (in: bacteria)]